MTRTFLSIGAAFWLLHYQKWYNSELGPPWENREKYDRLSPLLNAELFYQSLRKRGIDTQLVVYPGMHHGDWTSEFWRDYLNRVREWFDKYLN